MRRRLAPILVVTLAFACSSAGEGTTRGDAAIEDGMHEGGTGGTGGTGGSGRSGEPRACVGPVDVLVKRDGAPFAVVDAQVGGDWGALGGREIFRLRLETQHDPIPEAADDEVTLITAIDLVPSELLAQGGEPLAIDQHVAVAGFARSYVDDASVEVTSGAGHAYAVRRVLVEQSGFGTNPQPAAYDVTGQLTIELSSAHRVSGTLALVIEGSIPLAFESGTTRIEGCFDFTVEPPVDCQPGESCGNDCLAEEEYPCWDCGELFRTHDCQCRPDQPPLEECAADTPAGLGEPCGAQWWCDRPCGDGLTCRLDPGYGAEGDADAGVVGLCENYRTCQPAVAGDACVVVRRLDSCCAAFAAVTRAELEGNACLVQVPAGPLFGTDVIGPCVGGSCAGVDCADERPPSHLAVTDGRGGCRFADECVTGDDCAIGSAASGCCDCPHALPEELFADNACAVREGEAWPSAAGCLGCTAPVECGPCEPAPAPRCVERDGLRVCE